MKTKSNDKQVEQKNESENNVILANDSIIIGLANEYLQADIMSLVDNIATNQDRYVYLTKWIKDIKNLIQEIVKRPSIHENLLADKLDAKKEFLLTSRSAYKPVDPATFRDMPQIFFPDELNEYETEKDNIFIQCDETKGLRKKISLLEYYKKQIIKKQETLTGINSNALRKNEKYETLLKTTDDDVLKKNIKNAILYNRLLSEIDDAIRELKEQLYQLLSEAQNEIYLMNNTPGYSSQFVSDNLYDIYPELEAAEKDPPKFDDNDCDYDYDDRFNMADVTTKNIKNFLLSIGWEKSEEDFLSQIELLKESKMIKINDKFPLEPFILNMRIPAHACHPFRSKVATYSGGKLPPIPEHACHLIG